LIELGRQSEARQDERILTRRLWKCDRATSLKKRQATGKIGGPKPIRYLTIVLLIGRNLTHASGEKLVNGSVYLLPMA
jgi:hypothetical protein